MNQITAFARTTSSEARCPLCQHASGKVHSTYVRTLADLPCSGRHVRWLVLVRRFRCQNEACTRKIFTERLPLCAPASTRRIRRQAETLCELAFVLGGKVSAQIAHLLAMTVSHDTLLRLIRRSPSLEVSTPRVLGVDDFAWKKGNRYGTILIDLEKHIVIDILPDREKKTLENWLQNHPGVEIISRDRASAYAEAASSGAPQAIQVADRFHLLANLREHVKSFLDHKRATLPKVECAGSGVESAPPNAEMQALSVLMAPLPAAQEGDPEQEKALLSFVRDTKRELWFHTQLQPQDAHSQVCRSERLARFEQVKTLHEQGLSGRTIAHTLGISRETVCTFVQAETFPERRSPPRKARERKLDPFLPYLLKRWQEHEYNGTQLYREIVEQGYSGSRPSVALFIADLRRMHPPVAGAERAWMRKDSRALDYPTLEKSSPIAPPKRKRLTPSQVAWLFVCKKDRLTDRQQKQLELVCQAGADFQEVYGLTQDFVKMITEQRVERFENWVQRAAQSPFASFTGFATSLRRDADAVRAALTLPWSQGQTEGQVHRLKLLKRQGYGRASFDLLRLRVLHGSGKTYQEHMRVQQKKGVSKSA